jgi:hypothetical protein
MIFFTGQLAAVERFGRESVRPWSRFQPANILGSIYTRAFASLSQHDSQRTKNAIEPSRPRLDCSIFSAFHSSALRACFFLLAEAAGGGERARLRTLAGAGVGAGSRLAGGCRFRSSREWCDRCAAEEADAADDDEEEDDNDDGEAEENDGAADETGKNEDDEDEEAEESTNDCGTSAATFRLAGQSGTGS